VAVSGFGSTKEERGLMMMVDDYDSESLLHNLLLIISVESGHDDMIYIHTYM
jgi:hypothetical protein